MPTLKLKTGEMIVQIAEKRGDSLLVSSLVASHREESELIADLIEGQVYEIKWWDGPEIKFRHVRATATGVEELTAEEFNNLTIP